MELEDEQKMAEAGRESRAWPQQDAGQQHAATGAGDPAGTQAHHSPSCRGKSPLRQLSMNLYRGLRAALFLRVPADSICAGAAALAWVALTDVLLNLVVSFLLVGREGSFYYSALPSFFFHLPVLLLFALLASRVLSRPRLLTVIPVALVALSFPVELVHAVLERLAQLPELEGLADYLVAPHYYRFFSWWSAASLVFLLRLNPQASPRPRIVVLLLFTVLVLPPLWFYPRADLWFNTAQGGESGELRLTEEVLAAQGRLLDRKLSDLAPGEKGRADLYFVGFAGDATQDVFLKELTAAERLFAEHFGTSGRSVVLVNNPQTATTLPFATAGNLERSIARVGEVMNRDEDLLVLFLTSHGSREHQLTVSNPPLELNDLTPEKLRYMLRKSGVTWKVVVVSACYAGGFIDPLKDDGTMIITAADETHESFGCGYGEKFTWFGEAYLEHALRNTYSFTDAFATAREIIGNWEEEQGETPSNPQIWVGKGMERKLLEVERQLAERQAKGEP